MLIQKTKLIEVQELNKMLGMNRNFEKPDNISIEYVFLFMFLSFFQNDSLLVFINKAQKTSNEDVPALSLKEMKKIIEEFVF